MFGKRRKRVEREWPTYVVAAREACELMMQAHRVLAPHRGELPDSSITALQAAYKVRDHVRHRLGVEAVREALPL